MSPEGFVPDVADGAVAYHRRIHPIAKLSKNVDFRGFEEIAPRIWRLGPAPFATCLRDMCQVETTNLPGSRASSGLSRKSRYYRGGSSSIIRVFTQKRAGRPTILTQRSTVKLLRRAGRTSPQPLHRALSTPSQNVLLRSQAE